MIGAAPARLDYKNIHSLDSLPIDSIFEAATISDAFK